MPKVDVRATVAEQARQDFGLEPTGVVTGEDVYGGFFALFADRVVFYKELFGDIEKRGEYIVGQVTGVELKDGFGGKEIIGRYDGKEMRLRRLEPEDAALIARCFAGQLAAPTPPAPAIATPPPVPRPAPALARQPAALPPPMPDTAAIEEEWLEDTPKAAAHAAERHAAPVKEAKAAAPGKKGAGCLAWLVIIGVAGAGAWGFNFVNERIDRLRSRGDEAEVLRAELDAGRAETHKDIEELRAELAELRSSLAAGDEIDPWPTAPPLAGLSGEVEQETDRPASEEVYAVAVGDSPARGPDKAWVTLVVMCDLQNPHCANAGHAIADLRKSYSEELREVFKHLPSDINDRAFAAAHAAECAREQGVLKFWRYHDYVLANQKLLSTSPMTELVKKAGVSMKRWKKCYDAERHEERIANDIVLADALGVAWAPAFVVNGRLLPGVQSAAALEAAIEEELDKAKASDVPKGQYYRKVVMEQGEEP